MEETNELVKIFNSVRDIPYRLSLSLDEEDHCCLGKHTILYNLLKEKGCEVRYQICDFLWSSLNFPKEVKEIPHEDPCGHLYLEIKIKNKWKVLDATWDKGLEDILPVNYWDGKSETKIGVKPTRIYKPCIVEERADKATFKKEMEINGEFYKAFNEWLEKKRSVQLFGHEL